MIDCNQLRLEIIRPALRGIEKWSPEAENLLLGTAAQESRLGEFLIRLDGSALGIFGMHPDVHDDIRNNYLRNNPVIGLQALSASGAASYWSTWMISNLRYAAIFCRLHYLRMPAALPSVDDIEGMARYWKRYYITSQIEATESDFVANYRKYVR